MSEARTRRQNHFNSSIFPSSVKPSVEVPYLSSEFNSPNSCSSPNLKTRFTPTVKSSVFNTLPIPVPKPNPHRPQDTGDLLGNDQPDYYNKRHSAHIQSTEIQFIPNFKEVSAFDRRQQEFYKGYSPEEYTRSKLEDIYVAKKTDNVWRPNSSREGLNPQGKRAQEMASNVLEGTQPHYEYVKYSNYDEQSSEQRKDMLHSRVFGYSKTYEVPQYLEEQESPEKRKNHMYSDLFGAGMYQGRNLKKDQELRPVHVSPYESANSPPDYDYNPQNSSTRMLRSALDPKHYSYTPKATTKAQSAAEVPYNAKVVKNLEQRSTSELERFGGVSESVEPYLKDYKLTNLPVSMNSDALKELLYKVHVVKADLDMNNLTGLCKGTGIVTIRATSSKDLKEFELTLVSKGIYIQELSTKASGKKSNYNAVSTTNWYDSNLQIEEHRLGITSPTARQQRQHQLETSASIPGLSTSQFASDWKQTSSRPSSIKEDTYGKSDWNLRKSSVTQDMIKNRPSFR